MDAAMQSSRAIPDSRILRRSRRGSMQAVISEALPCLGILAVVGSAMLLCGWQIEQVRLSDDPTPAVANPVQAYP
jgi:hypothetical protein